MPQVVVAGRPFDATLNFFVDELGFRPTLITPADEPTLAVVELDGLEVRIDAGVEPSPVTLLIEGDGERRHGPGGIVVDYTPPRRMELPLVDPALSVVRGDDDGWVTGRAGMRYRDLIPGRWGGRYIASHIEVCDGGPVPDRVHHHDIRFQMIFCHRGWVDVVYQDQGPPFRMEAGDCVLQPPGIRHQVLASSAGARVVEIGCPAAHDTLFDNELALPTDTEAPEAVYGGQRFVRHGGADVAWTAAGPGRHVQATAIEAATDGLACVEVWSLAPDAEPLDLTHNAELRFVFVLDGAVQAATGTGEPEVVLTTGSAMTVPPATACSVVPAPGGAQLLDVVVEE
ncbi:MAG: cupin [Actinomycetota bacterium]